MKYRGIELVMTCGACPEQYDAYNEHGRMVGYLRLRHGYFSVEVPNCGGAIVFEAEPQGDGSFDGSERDTFLKAAIDAIKDHAA